MIIRPRYYESKGPCIQPKTYLLVLATFAVENDNVVPFGGESIYIGFQWSCPSWTSTKVSILFFKFNLFTGGISL